MSRPTSETTPMTNYEATSYLSPSEINSQYQTNSRINTSTSIPVTPESTENTNAIDTNLPNDDIRSNDGTLFLSHDKKYTSNESWGDQLNDKAHHTIRIYFQNINGIIYKKSWDKWKETVDILNEHNIDVAGLVETNINWNPTNCSIAQSILRVRNKNSVMQNSHSDEPTTSSYQPGGMSLILQNNLIGAIDSNGNDDRGLGRWSFSIINGKQHHKLVIITAYRLTHDNIPGDDTVYAQQYRLLRRQ